MWQEPLGGLQHIKKKFKKAKQNLLENPFVLYDEAWYLNVRQVSIYLRVWPWGYNGEPHSIPDVGLTEEKKDYIRANKAEVLLFPQN